DQGWGGLLGRMMEGSMESWVRWWSRKSLGFICIVSPWVSEGLTGGSNEAEANVLPKLLRRYYDAFRPAQSTHGGKSLALMGLDAGSLLSMLAAHDPSTAMKSVRGPEPLSYVNPLPHLEKDIITAIEILTEDAATVKVNIHFSVGSPELGRSSSVSSMVGSSRSIYQRGWGVTNDYFLDQYNITLARQVAMGSQLRLRFEQEVRLLKKARSKIAKQDQRIQVLNLQAQVMGEENIKVAFEEFKKYKDDKVEQRCTKIDARLDKLSVDFDEELYPHMLTAIAGGRWVIGHGLHLAVMKYVESSEIRQAFADVVSAGLAKGMNEGLKYGIEHGKAGQDLADIEAYNPESNNKLVKALQDLKDLKYPMIDQLEKLKHTPMDLIMASLYLESDTREDSPQWIQDMMLEDAIAANISWVEKKKKCRVVCRTQGIGSAHHTRSDGIPIFAPTAPQGLAILLADAATQTKAVDHKEPHPRL
nr:hypothetical protein [Tanacetum cinerariifolium]